MPSEEEGMPEARVGHIDELGDGMVRKVRHELGVEAFGVNAMVFEPGGEGRRHSHEQQDELYFVHSGTPEIEIEGIVYPLRPGSVAHVPAQLVRQLRNGGSEPAVFLIVGASGGYVGRDGRLDDGSAAGSQQPRP
jgi:quercetin dioxygenase-like cupin family protein